MSNERVEILKKQLADIDKMMDECQGKKGLDRLMDHLRGRRNMTIHELNKLRVKF